VPLFQPNETLPQRSHTTPIARADGAPVSAAGTSFAGSARRIFANVGGGSFLQLDSIMEEHRDDIFGRKVKGFSAS
jgi:hypothetical protein